MIFKEWFNWIYNAPWSIKWFILLILIRPVVDVFYFVKDISIFLSPPIIVAALTPFLVLISIGIGKKNRIRTGLSYIDLVVCIWAGIILLNSISLLDELDVILWLDVILRLIIPFFIYLYSRVFVRSLQHLYFILITTLIAALFPAVMFVLELIVGPFGTQITRGSILRYHGLYADIFNYAIYCMFAFIIGGFLYMGPGRTKTAKLLSGKKYILIVLFILVVLLHIAHVTTFIIFMVLVFIFIYLNKEVNILKVGFVTLTISIIIYSLFSSDIQRVVGPMIDREIGILKGERNIELLAHGRLGRIIDYQEVWRQQPVYAKVFGMSFSYIHDKGDWFGGSIHNEYIRSLYTGGIIGLISYLIFLFLGFIKARKFPASERFLFYSLLILVSLYSFTMLPMLYYNLLYIFMPAMAYLSHTSNLSKREIRQIL